MPVGAHNAPEQSTRERAPTPGNRNFAREVVKDADFTRQTRVRFPQGAQISAKSFDLAKIRTEYLPAVIGRVGAIGPQRAEPRRAFVPSR
jgi:hypothetical protein